MAGETRDGSCFRDRWRDLVASADGPPSATTRHVLITLSLHMDGDGGQCFPSTRLLAERTGVSERVVCAHLALAADGGWIRKGRRPGASGQGWRRNEYQAMPRKALTQGKRLTSKGTDAESARSVEGTDPNGKKALTQGQSNQSRNQSVVGAPENGAHPIKSPTVIALEAVCMAMGADWYHKTLTPEQWISQKAVDRRFSSLDMVAVFSDAADYLSSNCSKKYTSPCRFLLNQLKMASERAAARDPGKPPFPKIGSDRAAHLAMMRAQSKELDR